MKMRQTSCTNEVPVGLRSAPSVPTCQTRAAGFNFSQHAQNSHAPTCGQIYGLGQAHISRNIFRNIPWWRVVRT
eukprot:4108782-Prymnesium_polylepis.1